MKKRPNIRDIFYTPFKSVNFRSYDEKPPEQMKHCFVLILAVDAVGYSYLMEINEKFAVSLLGASLNTIDEVV